MPERIALAGEARSPNLGDPLVHACLAHLLALAGAGAVESIDFEERPAIPDLRLARTRHLPPLLRTSSWWLLRRPSRLRTWSGRLAGCRALCIGGGQILDDRGMLFPPRLATLAEAARRQEVPVVLLACGAAASWTGLGHRLVDQPLARVLRAALVRDRASARHLAAAFPTWPTARVAPDPAVWAGELYGLRAQRADAAPVGLGVTGLAGHDADAAAAWWCALVRHLDAAGLPCRLFGNGDAGDEALLRRVATTTGAQRAAHPRHPRELLETIAACRAVASGRLHGGIAAFALGVPALSVLAHPKSAGFWEMVGLPERALGPADPGLVARRLIDLHRGGGDPPGLLPRARAAIADAVAAVVPGLPGRQSI